MEWLQPRGSAVAEDPLGVWNLEHVSELRREHYYIYTDSDSYGRGRRCEYRT